MMLKTSLQRICSNLAIIEAIMAGTNSLKRFLKKLLVQRNPKINKTLRSVHFGVVVVELINCKCEGIVRTEIW